MVAQPTSDSNADRRVVVAGAGGHAKVAIEALRFSGWKVIGCTDPDPTARTVVGAPVLGTDDILAEIRRSGVSFAFPAVGANAARQRLGEHLRKLGFTLPRAIAPNAVIAPSAHVGAGVAIFAGAVINAEAEVADFAILNTNASVDHDCKVGVAAHVAPGCALAGCVVVGDRAFIGAGASVIPGVMIGSDTMVGAGSVVVRDVADGVTVMGVPARVRDSDDER
jgi:UDP-perosamine 4-acetyltransferase